MLFRTDGTWGKRGGAGVNERYPPIVAKIGAKPVTLNGLPLKFSDLPTDLLLLYPPEVFSSILSFGKVAR